MSLDSNRLTKSVKKLRKFLKQASNTPRPEEVHSFRTHARRLEATLEALGLDSEDNERPLRDLVRLRKRAGKVRDMDVLTANALTVRLDDEQNCSVQLLEYLGAERYRQAKKLGREVESCRTGSSAAPQAMLAADCSRARKAGRRSDPGQEQARS